MRLCSGLGMVHESVESWEGPELCINIAKGTHQGLNTKTRYQSLSSEPQISP